MKKSRFSEDRGDPEAGAKTAEACRHNGISQATYYQWKARYGGLEVNDAKRL